VSYKVRDQFDSLLSDFDINSFLLLDISFRHDLLDISPTLSEAAGAIVDVSFFLHLLFIVLLFLSF
jgi:hypothetical protein